MAGARLTPGNGLGHNVNARPPLRLRNGFAIFPLVGAAVAVLVGGLTLLGWTLDIVPLTVAIPGGVAMNPVTAVAAVLAGVALFLSRQEAGLQSRRFGQGFGLLVALAGAVVLGKYLFGCDLGLDVALFRGKLGDNRMAPNTALLFVLIGGTLALLDVPTRTGRWAAQLLLLPALALCLAVLVGYSFGVKSFYGVGAYIPMAFNTAVVFTALAAGVLFARPDRGVMALLGSSGAGGMLARRLMPAAVAVPWALGWLRLAGEWAGFYDAPVGVSLMVISTITLFLLMIWVSGVRLDRIDADRGRAGAALRRSSEEIRDLYEHAPCGYHSVGPDGLVLVMNQTELRWLGYAEADVIGRMRFADVVSPASRDTYRATFARVKEHGAATDVELELVRKDGTTFPALLNSSAVRDPDGHYLRSRTTLTDLTERKRAEAAVRMFADVVTNIPIGLHIYQLDPTGDPPTLRVRSENPVALNLLGVSLDLATGQAITDVFPAIPESLVRRYAGVVASQRADNLGEFQYGDTRVANRWWAVQAFPLPDRCVGVAFQDVSARKEAEAEIRRLNDELEERVRTRTAELAEANRDLGHKNAENEMFVYSVSHDLRSPLVNLQGFSKELDKGCQALATILADESLPPAVRDQGSALLDGKMTKALGFIQSAVLRLSGIIDALLRLSRVGRVEYRPEAVDVQKMVARVIGAMQGTITERGATVTAGGLPSVWGDPTAIEQVFANLVGNALTYLDPARPGVIEVGCLPPVAAGVPDGFRVFYVRDNGLGIADGHRAKIFQVFQRAHPHVAKGEGMGLAIVSRVAERHRGRVWVESAVGEGSTFYVTLPAPA